MVGQGAEHRKPVFTHRIATVSHGPTPRSEALAQPSRPEAKPQPNPAVLGYQNCFPVQNKYSLCRPDIIIASYTYPQSSAPFLVLISEPKALNSKPWSPPKPGPNRYQLPTPSHQLGPTFFLEGGCRSKSQYETRKTKHTVCVCVFRCTQNISIASSLS